MTDEEYAQTQEELMVLARWVNGLDLDGFLSRIRLAETSSTRRSTCAAQTNCSKSKDWRNRSNHSGTRYAGSYRKKNHDPIHSSHQNN
ncbi:MAG: hypothetical protein KF770_17550 [Anaerolineae bacterium]|nr:hypothetical protein [Anaerolineae bacterium]